MTLNEFLNQAWNRYVDLAPDALVIHKLLEERGERIQNDHIAFRTFNLKGIGRMDLGKIFENWGYQRVKEDLDFPAKKLKASYFLHSDPTLPKIFISELLLEQFSFELQSWIKEIVSQNLTLNAKEGDFFLRDSWSAISFEDYQRFYSESEYAAWTAAFGIQVNHFTLLVNSLKTFSTLQELNLFLGKVGIVLNEAGGVVKGTPTELLEQSSTLAKKVDWTFASGKRHKVMGCYYEFARRYLVPGEKKLFEGFIPKSADKIFESTYEKSGLKPEV
ncbi:MAG: DUF1338 domain-containing protein [Bdellovibrionia bacterium]